jgi:hypothetical protein
MKLTTAVTEVVIEAVVAVAVVWVFEKIAEKYMKNSPKTAALMAGMAPVVVKRLRGR